mgnify:CR=1 FL=1
MVIASLIVQGVLRLLLPQNSDNKNAFRLYPIENRVRAVHTAAIPFTDMIDGGVSFRLHCEFTKALLHAILVVQGLDKAETITPEIENIFKIAVRGLG